MPGPKLISEMKTSRNESEIRTPQRFFPLEISNCSTDCIQSFDSD